MENEMREKLRLLLLEDVECDRRPCSTCPYNYSDDACFEQISGLVADNLIENGVILLPCKVGDTVYDRYGNPIEIQGVGIECFFKGVHKIEDSSIGYPFFENRTLSLPVTFSTKDIGEAVFLEKPSKEVHNDAE